MFTGLYPPQALDYKTYSEGWVDTPHAEWGAGPFTVEKADKDSVTFIARNPKWWGNTAKLDKVVYKVHGIHRSGRNAFKNSEIDALDLHFEQHFANSERP